MNYFTIKKASKFPYKFTAYFFDKEKKLIKTTNFGDRRYEDYTSHNDNKRKENYIKRHRLREDWKDFKTAGALSRWILWEEKTLNKSINNYIKKFNLKK